MRIICKCIIIVYLYVSILFVYMLIIYLCIYLNFDVNARGAGQGRREGYVSSRKQT
jgi:hypothetical protein